MVKGTFPGLMEAARFVADDQETRCILTSHGTGRVPQSYEVYMCAIVRGSRFIKPLGSSEPLLARLNEISSGYCMY
jgi:hypothetical protein